MRIAAKSVVALTLILGLAACGSPAEEKTAAGADSTTASPAAAATTAAAAADGRPAAFAQCVACHSTEKGKMGIGPSLVGVYGTKSGEIAGFAFSDAMKNANLTWDDATLDKYLAAPMKMVPGTKMTFAGLTDAAKRKEVIEYLKTLK